MQQTNKTNAWNTPEHEQSSDKDIGSNGTCQYFDVREDIGNTTENDHRKTDYRNVRQIRNFSNIKSSKRLETPRQGRSKCRRAHRHSEPERQPRG